MTRLLAARTVAAVFAAAALALPGFAQDPPPDDGAGRGDAGDVDAAGGDGIELLDLDMIQRNNRRAVPTGKVVIAWDEITVPETLPWIAKMTGKVVMPVNLVALKSKKISLHTDEPIEQADALDMLFQAFRLNSVGVIEKSDVVIIGMIDEIKLVREMPVIPADQDISDRIDRGTLVVKIFKLQEVPATGVYEQLEEIMPTYATHSVDPNSNQIVVMGDIALCQHLETLIEELDNQYMQPKTQTFRLAYADATEVSDNILDLFESDGGSTSSSTRTNTRSARTPTRPGRQSTTTPGSPIGPEIELRLTVNIQQNSVTVTAEPAIIDEISRLVDEEWDLPRSPGTSKIYTLHYTDPLKIAEKLDNLLGGSGGGGGAGGQQRGRGGSSGSTGVEQILSGIYSIEPYPDTNQLFVFCKTEQSLQFLDGFIESVDQPSSIGLPFVEELKHANAIELAEELNALLSEPGAQATVQRPETGISGRTSTDDGGGAGVGTGASGGGDAGTMSFPWQRSGRQRDDQSPESQLIGKVRIVPIVRQNALAVLCPAPQRESVRELIQYFDKPGRQVMISAVIAEVELSDELALGLRLSNSDEVLGGANPDFRFGISGDGSGQRDPLFGAHTVLGQFFNTSILDAAFPVRAAIQFLQQKTNVRILQEPVIFTADNQEALFFDGQDIPFITNTTINAQGNPNDSFEYREVGVVLNVRPRITVQRDVDLEILLELSSVVPGQTLFGGAIIDRRETRTHVVLQNEQTIVLSGILRDEENKITRKIPLLGDIPIIGELFKSRENTTRQTELIAFITPYVVDNPSENDFNFNQEARRQLEELQLPIAEQLKLRRSGEYRGRFLPNPANPTPLEGRRKGPVDE